MSAGKRYPAKLGQVAEAVIPLDYPVAGSLGMLLAGQLGGAGGIEKRFMAGRLFGDDDDHAFKPDRWY